MMRKLSDEEKAVIQDFEHWVGEMEEKHETVSANIYTHIMRYLNRMDRKIKRDVKRVMAEPFIEVPEKYKTTDWMRKIMED